MVATVGDGKEGYGWRSGTEFISGWARWGFDLRVMGLVVQIWGNDGVGRTSLGVLITINRAWVARWRCLWVFLGSVGFKVRVQIKFLRGTGEVPGFS